MASLTVYALKSCDTCRKALVEMTAAGRTPAVVDIRADGFAPHVLSGLVKDLGPEVLINRRSTTWRGLDEAARTRAMDPATAAMVLAEHPTLMKRPVIVGAGKTLVGWTPAVRAAIIG